MRRFYTSYNPTKKEDEEETGKPAVCDGNVVVTGNIRPVLIELPSEAEAKYIEEEHNTPVSSDVGDPVTFTETLESKRGRLWKLSIIAEVNNFLYSKAWIPRKLESVQATGRKPVPVKWVFNTKLEPEGLERLKSRIVTKGYL